MYNGETLTVNNLKVTGNAEVEKLDVKKDADFGTDSGKKLRIKGSDLHSNNTTYIEFFKNNNERTNYIPYRYSWSDYK